MSHIIPNEYPLRPCQPLLILFYSLKLRLAAVPKFGTKRKEEKELFRQWLRCVQPKEGMLLYACLPQGLARPIGAEVKANHAVESFRLEEKKNL